MKYLTQVYYNNTWVTLDTLRVSFERSLDWGKPMTATIEVDNRNGENRSICTLSSLIKIYRNDTLKFFGVIDKPSISVKPDGRNLTIQAKDYWTDKLMNTQTGDAYIWDFDHLDPVDVYRAFIGTMLIVQEKFQNFRRIDETTLNNLCILDQKLQLIKNGSTYQNTGSVTSKTLQNSTDWDRMGDIKSVGVSIEGTSTSSMINIITTNSGFESTGGWTDTFRNYDLNKTDTTTSDFNTGIRTNVQAINNSLILLAQSGGVAFDKFYTTTADFDTGTKSNVSSAGDTIQLTSPGANFNRIYTTTADFDTGTKSNVSSAGDTIQLTRFSTPNWYSTYTYRKSHTINGSSDGTLSDYQIKIRIYKGTGVDNGNTVYLNNRCQSWTGTVPNDVRFTSSDKLTSLNYWIEYSDSSYADIWVKVPNIPAWTGTTIYIYYGKSGDTTTSNINNTMLFGDHFDTLDTNKWNLLGNASVTGSCAYIYSGTQNGSEGKFTTKTAYPVNNVAMGLRYQLYDTNTWGGGAGSLTVFGPTNCKFDVKHHRYTYISQNVNDCYVFDIDESTKYEDNIVRPNSWSDWIVAEVRIGTSTVTAYKNNVQVYTGAISSSSTSSYYLCAKGVDPSGSYSQYTNIDYFYIRNYTNNEPTHGSWGIEEYYLTYNSSGIWQTSSLSISNVIRAYSSSITWSASVPANTTLTVQTSLDGGSTWQTCTNGGSIPGITNGYDCTGKTIIVKAALTTSTGFNTPVLSDITISITSGRPFSGIWQTSSLSISNVIRAYSSSITWSASVPANTTLTVQTSLDGGSTWQTCTNGGSIPGITNGYDCTGKTIIVKAALTGDGLVTPSLYDVTLNITPKYLYYTGGNRISTIDLASVEVCKSSIISWTATKPANTDIIISVSFDGVNYTTCTNGQPIPILTDGLNVIDKILYIKQELSTTDPYVTPSLDSLIVSVISKCNGVVETSNVDPYEGQKCLHLSCESYREPYNRVSQRYPATAGKMYVLSYRCKGLASNCKVYLEAWNSSGNWLGNVASTPTDSAQYVEYTLQYTVPANTAAIDVVIQGNGIADARFDSFFLGEASQDLLLQVSRDGGVYYYNVPLVYNGAQWTGSFMFTDNFTVKNKFKYRLTLNSFNNNTPLISSLLFKCQTESDTGVTLAYADTWNNPYTADDTITQSFGGMSRFQAITNLIKITGQEPYIDVDGKLYVYNSLNENLPILDLDTDNHLVNLDYALVRDAMCNALTLIGNGQVSTNVNIYGRVSLKDDASIAQYGWLEKTMSEKNIKDLGMLGARCYVILQQLKVPAEKISGSLIEPETSNITIGQRVRIIDITGSTGIDPTKVYRISQLQYSYNANGETISVEFANVRTELENAIEALTDYISSYMGVDQPAGLPVPATFMADCDKDNPCEKLVWIDPNKSPKRIILNVFSRAFQATSKGGVIHGQHSHKFWVYNHVHGMNHTHEISSHTHPIPHTHGHPPDGEEIGNILSGFLTVYGGGTTTSGASNEQTTGGGGQDESTSSEDSGHTHPLEYGIFKFGYFAPVTMHVNSPDIGAYPRFGTQGSETLDFTVTGLDITELYNKEGGVGKLAPGKNFIYFKTSATPNNPLGLLRIYTEILVIYD